ESSYHTYNALLVGLSLGYLFKFTALTVFLVVSAGAMTFLVTAFMASVFMTHLRLPVLSLPFVVVSSVAYLASIRYQGLPVRLHDGGGILSGDLGLPFWLAGFFKALGAVLFMPGVVAGIVLALLLLRHSRILFVLAVMGYLVGATTRSLMVGSAEQGFADINNFNFIFIAMALGGIFLMPSPTSYLIAAIAVTISTLFTDAAAGVWYYHGIPVFTLPFNIVTLGIVYVLGLVRHPLVPSSAGRTPKETLEHSLANRLRYRGEERTLYLPFAGKWTVWQGRDGAWTHKGPWRHAYDFVIADEHGRTYSGKGDQPSDYHSWNKPVLAPVRGRVVRVVDDLPDGPVGGSDEANKWGNVVVVEDARGFFVELSHFAASSIRVKKGDWIERGAVLGLCGNSGYSPQPHIHIQAQATDSIGAPSIPFSFVSYAAGGEFQSNNLPRERDVVEPLYRDRRLDNITNFVLDDELHYQVMRDGRQVDVLKMTVKMAVDGTFYFESPRGQLYFGKHEGTFYFYRVAGSDPWLRELFLAMPRLPLASREPLAWCDYVRTG
ncbi:MAG: urea transporter, partial [bacterium]